jgi:hypothetical protein
MMTFSAGRLPTIRAEFYSSDIGVFGKRYTNLMRQLSLESLTAYTPVFQAGRHLV